LQEGGEPRERLRGEGSTLGLKKDAVFEVWGKCFEDRTGRRWRSFLTCFSKGRGVVKSLLGGITQRGRNGVTIFQEPKNKRERG